MSLVRIGGRSHGTHPPPCESRPSGGKTVNDPFLCTRHQFSDTNRGLIGLLDLSLCAPLTNQTPLIQREGKPR